jgi:O-antigen/teichoic acid export membrane protein
MLVNVFGVSVVTAVLTVFRFALTGINRHRQLAVGDFVSGALAIASSFIVVQKFGYQWVGCAGICALALTTGWIAPREFNRTIGAMRIWPNIRFWLRWGIAVCVAFVVGGGVMHLLSGFALWASMPLAAVTIIAIYVLVVYVFFRHEGDYAVLSLNSPAPADPDQF